MYNWTSEEWTQLCICPCFCNRPNAGPGSAYKKKKKKLTSDLENLETDIIADAEVAELHLLQLLLLGLHDVGQARVAGLVEAQVRGYDHGQRGADRLDAAVDLLGDGDAVGLAKLDLAGLGGLRPAEQAGEHLARLAGVVVDALLAEHHQVAPLLLDGLGQQLGHRQRRQVLALGHLDVDAAVSAHGHGGAQHVLRLGRAGRDDANVLDAARAALLLADPHRLLDRELVKGIHRVLDAGRLDARLGLVDAGLDLQDGGGGRR